MQLPEKSLQPSRPIDTFRRENIALRRVIGKLRSTMAEIAALDDSAECTALLLQLC